MKTAKLPTTKELNERMAAHFAVRNTEETLAAEEDNDGVDVVINKLWTELSRVIKQAPDRSYQETTTATDRLIHAAIGDLEDVVGIALEDCCERSYDSAWEVWKDVLPVPYWKVAFPKQQGIMLLESIEDEQDKVAKPPTKAEIQKIVQSTGYRQRLAKWSNKITNKDKVGEIIAQGVAKGWDQERIAKRVAPHVQSLGSSAKRIVRTETARIANQMAERTFEQFDSIIRGYQIIAILDSVTRPTHAARHGTIFWKDKKPYASERPELPDEPNCRCSYAPVLDDPSLNKGLGFQELSTATYGEWFAAQPWQVQQKVVGKARWDSVVGEGLIPQWVDFVDPETGQLMPWDELDALSRDEILKKRTDLTKKILKKTEEAQRILQKDQSDFAKGETFIIKKMTPAQILAMTPEQVGSLPPGKLANYNKAIAKIKKQNGGLLPPGKGPIGPIGGSPKPPPSGKKKTFFPMKMSDEEILAMTPADVATLNPTKKKNYEKKLAKALKNKGLSPKPSPSPKPGSGLSGGFSAPSGGKKGHYVDQIVGSKYEAGSATMAIEDVIGTCPKVGQILQHKPIKKLNVSSKLIATKKKATKGCYTKDWGLLEVKSTMPVHQGPLNIGGFNVTHLDIPNVTNHELGHHVHYWLEENEPDAWYEFLKIQKGMPGYKIGTGISTYAKTNPKETFAESFAAYMHPEYGTSPSKTLPPEIETYMMKHFPKGLTKKKVDIVPSPKVDKPMSTTAPGIDTSFFSEDVSWLRRGVVEKFPSSTMEQQRQWRRNAPQHELSKIRTYTGGAYQQINHDLRNGREPTGSNATSVAAIRKAVKDIGEFAEPVRVFRGGGSGNPQKHEKIIAGIRKAMETGGTFTDPGVISTSRKSDTAVGFAKGKPQIVFEIKAKTGIHAEEFSNYKNEAEIIQAPGTRYRPVRIIEVPNRSGYGSTLVVQCEEV